uniref:Uncharacterized protein LOC112814329 isoform X2 n=1 Tax=Callorhinus ursinus TaxID=34884 RepID=A0A3Q7N6F7_CALUR|nr:uncharacterized protein LOC112814329 isoform X2 [Callorhinus ursinus]
MLSSSFVWEDRGAQGILPFTHCHPLLRILWAPDVLIWKKAWCRPQGSRTDGKVMAAVPARASVAPWNSVTRRAGTRERPRFPVCLPSGRTSPARPAWHCPGHGGFLRAMPRGPCCARAPPARGHQLALWKLDLQTVAEGEAGETVSFCRLRSELEMEQHPRSLLSPEGGKQARTRLRIGDAQDQR